MCASASEKDTHFCSRPNVAAVLRAAYEYHDMGMSIFPVKGGTKIAACPWKGFQSIPPSRSGLSRLFTGNRGIAVALGDVSDALVCRDFDDADAYERWALQHPQIARTLPTVKTGRDGGGYHVYLTADLADIRDASSSGSTIIVYGDGELRGGGYCVLPPSRHPSGRRYRWIRPPFDFPFVSDLVQTGLLRPTMLAADSRQDTDGTQDNTKT